MHPSWHPDPTGRHELRYWDGSTWTDHVADQGAQAVDPLIPEPASEPASGSESESESVSVSESESFGEEAAGVEPSHAGPGPVPQADEVWAETPQASSPDPEAMAAQGFAGNAFAGITGELIDGRYSEKSGDNVARQNNRMLRVRVTEPFMARQGSMVAYQGNVTFAYQGGGAAKFLKKALTGEGVPLMRVEGSGDVFLADQGHHVHILNLHDTGISISGTNVLAFSAGLDWNVERVKGGSIATGGLFNTTVRGTGWVAITTDGEPVVLNAGEAATFADTDAVVAWSAHLQTSLRSTMSAGALIGRGSGEAVQVTFAGQGFVIVQPSEGAQVPQHNH